MKNVKLKKIDVLSFAILMASVGVGIGLIAGVLFSSFSAFFGLITSSMNQAMPSEQSANVQPLFTFFGVGAIIFLPIFYGISGFVAGVIQAFIINLALKITKGLKLEVDVKK